MKKYARAIAAASLAGFGGFVVPAAAVAAPVPISGSDPGAGSSDPRPLSTGAAASFDAAVALLGPVNTITFESAALGFFSSLSLGNGVTLTGSGSNSAQQTIRSAPFGTPDQFFGYNTTAGGTKLLSLYGGNATFSFASPVQAFGAYFPACSRLWGRQRSCSMTARRRRWLCLL